MVGNVMWLNPCLTFHLLPFLLYQPSTFHRLPSTVYRSLLKIVEDGLECYVAQPLPDFSPSSLFYVINLLPFTVSPSTVHRSLLKIVEDGWECYVAQPLAHHQIFKSPNLLIHRPPFTPSTVHPFYSALPLAASMIFPKKIAFIINFVPPSQKPRRFGLSAIFITRPAPMVFTITAALFFIASRFWVLA